VVVTKSGHRCPQQDVQRRDCACNECGTWVDHCNDGVRVKRCTHTVVVRVWCVVVSEWMDYGLWTMDYGLWTMDYGLWSMDYGPVDAECQDCQSSDDHSSL
jgi:hypothetical protein